MRKSAPHFRIFVIGGNLPWLLNLQVGVGLSWFPHVLLLWILDEKSGSNITSTMDVQLANNVSLGKCFGCACAKPTWSFKLWRVLLAWFPHSQYSIRLALVKLSLNHLSTISPHRKLQGGFGLVFQYLYILGSISGQTKSESSINHFPMHIENPRGEFGLVFQYLYILGSI